MRLKEQRLWDRMRAHRPEDVRLERVENMAGDGFPDVLAKPRGAEPIVCELKAALLLPIRGSTRVFGDEGLRVDQRNWLLDWDKYNGRAVILASACEGAAAMHWAIPGRLADEFNAMTVAELRLASVTLGVERGRDFWAAFFNYMKDLV